MLISEGRRQKAAWVRLVREPLSEMERLAMQDLGQRIRNPQDVWKLLKSRMENELQETFVVVSLDSQSHVLGVTEVTRGILNSSLVHPREVFRIAIALGAAGIIVAHNHPSGNPTASNDDRAVTRQLVDAGKVIDIPVYDHIIIGDGRYSAFSEMGLL